MDQTRSLAEQLMTRFPRFFQDPAECAAVAARFHEREWEAGAQLYKFGEHSSTMHFVPHGALTISLDGDAAAEGGGASVLLAGGGDGTFVGELGLLRPGKISATVQAAGPLLSLELTHDDLVAMLTSSDRTEVRAATHLISALGVLVASRLRGWSAGHFTRGPGNTATFESALAALHGDDEASPFEGSSELPPTLDSHWSPSADERKALDAKLLECICAMPELKPLGTAMQQMLSRLVMVQRAQPGDVIIDEDMDAHGIYLVVEGAVRVRVTPETGQDTDVNVDRLMGPCQVFGMVSYALRCPPTAHVEAAEPNTVLAVFSEVQLKELLRMGDSGMPVGALFRHWMAGQLADDARALNDRILAQFGSWSSDDQA